MPVRYKIQFFDVLTEADATGYIDEPVVTLSADPVGPGFNFCNDHDFLGQALCVRTNGGRPMVAQVVIFVEFEGSRSSYHQRNYFIGDPGCAVAVRFGGVLGDCKPFALHSYDDDLKLWDIARNSL